MNKTSRLVAVVLTLVVALGVLTVAQRVSRDSVGAGRLLSTDEQTVRDLDTRLARMEQTHELRLRATQIDTMVPGRSFERLDQYYHGVPVFGGEAVREADRDVTRSITASLYNGIAIDINPRLSPASAAAIFMNATGADARTTVNPQLVVLPRGDGSFVLAYRMSAVVRASLPVVFVNATTGGVERRYNNLRTQQATALIGSGVLVGENLVSSDLKKVSCAVQGSIYTAQDLMRPVSIQTYDLKGSFTRTDSIVNGLTALTTTDLATNTGSTWTDSVVVDGHTYVGWTYDYFYKRDGWKGFDGNNVRLVSVIVHPVNRADLNKYAWTDVADYYANAFFCGQCGYHNEDLMVFGEGLPSGYYLSDTGQYADYFVASLSIVAHEYTHGVTTSTSNLIYQNESGALDEAFSDMMGQSVGFFERTATGSGLLQADYLQGKETFRPKQPGSVYGSRNIGNPSAMGDPDHYALRYTGTDDNGGVHTNSTIASYAFYLAIEGGTNHTSGLSVTGVGAANRAQIERAFFRGFTTLPANATFSMARAKTIQAARDLYGGIGSAVETAITQAWTAVGVF
jgi:thermolysin